MVRYAFKHKDYVHSFQSFPCLYKPKEINIETILDINKKKQMDGNIIQTGHFY